MIPRTAEVLQRFSALFPLRPLPPDISGLAGHEALELSERDPELHSLLSGTAPAELELAVLRGEFSPQPPAQLSPQDAARAAAEALVAEHGNPWGVVGSYSDDGTFNAPTPPNWTHQLLVQRDHPELAQQLAAEWEAANPAATSEQVYEAARAAELQQQSDRISSLARSGAGTVVITPPLS